MTGKALAAIVMLAALLFGSVEIWSGVPVLLAVYTLALVWVLRKGYEEAEAGTLLRFLMAGCAALFVLACFQLVPLPHSVLRLIAPHTATLRAYYAPGDPALVPLSVNPFFGMAELAKLVAFIAVFLVSAFYFQERGSVSAFFRVMVVFGFCLALFSIVQKATGTGKIYWFRELTAGGNLFGPFVNRNHFAGFIGMIVPFGLGLTLSTRFREKRLLFGFMTVIMAVSLFLSLSRGGIVSFLVGIAVFVSAMILGSSQRKAWAVGLFLFALIAYLIYLGVNPVIDRFYATDVSREQRWVVWGATWAGFKDFWLFGSGFGTFINVYPLYSAVPVETLFDHAHNDYLEFLLEGGVVGAGIVALCAAVLVRRLVRMKKTGHAGMIRAALLGSLATMLVHSAFDFNLHILSNMLLFCVLLGMLAARAAIHEEEEPVPDKQAASPDSAWKLPDLPFTFSVKDVGKRQRRRRRTAHEEKTDEEPASPESAEQDRKEP